MPRYFFHLKGPDIHVPDPDGADFANADEAWEAARRTARALMRTEVEMEAEWPCRFEILNEGGEIVFDLPFSEVRATSTRSTKTAFQIRPANVAESVAAGHDRAALERRVNSAPARPGSIGAR